MDRETCDPRIRQLAQSRSVLSGRGQGSGGATLGSRRVVRHAGRPFEASRITAAFYVLGTVAATARVSAGFLIGEQQAVLAVAGAAWFGAFDLFLSQHISIPLSARNDGAGENGS
ncbi:hypothetical protein GRI62_12425 [Erythrobacter arachoides]|uniref:Uncharacterized protein n=2 Tax=Aurantiacibacter arachoides TaxID=1850444 RepID=A0A845A4Q0_9SPHN|nr:hypothetical protein [Aurantiacibacter arachoides]